MIWNLQIKKGRGFFQLIKNRLISFVVITGLGVLLLVSLLINGLLEGFMGRLQDQFPYASIWGIYIFNLVLTLVVVGLLFSVIYKVMPDAILRWRDVIPGALFTSVLFMIGKFAVTFYINNTPIASSFGSAGSVIILLVWIFFSSVTLYFGAEFTKAYAMRYADTIRPRPYAVTYKITKEITRAKSIQENEEAW